MLCKTSGLQMQFKYKLDQDKKKATVKMSGIQDIDEYIAFYKELMTDIEGKGITSILWDARKLDVRKVTTGHIEKGIMFMNHWSSIRKGGKSACVVKDVFSYGIGRMFQNMAEAKNLFERNIKIEIFKDYKEAEKWICE